MKKLNTRDDDTPVLEGAWGDIDLGTQMYTKAGVESRLGDISTTVSQYIAEKISVAYKAGGSKAAANFTSALLVAANEGMVYNLTDTLTIDAQKASLFVDAAEGKAFAPGTNIVVVNTAASGETAAYKFDVLAPTDATLVKSVNGQTPNASGEVTIPEATTTDVGLMSATDKTKLNGVAEGAQVNVIETVKVDNVALTPDANKAVNIDLSGKANQSEMAIEDVTGDATKKTITLKNDLSQDVVVAHQDISGKADKVAKATSGNFAGLDANGNLTDSGKNAADFQPAGNYKTTQTAITTDPDATGTASAVVTSVKQNANGEITVVRANLPAAATVDQIYNPHSTNAQSGTAVAQAVSGAVGDLNAEVTSSDGTNVQVKVTQADGVVTAVNITSDTTASRTHTHGNISNDGKVGTASGKVLVTGASGAVEAGELDGAYNATTNKVATQSTVTDAIAALDVTEVSVGASKTVDKISETDGKISVTAAPIQIAESQVTDLTTDLAAKVDKVTGATADHIATFVTGGGIQDSGKVVGDFATAAQGAKADSAVQGVKLAGAENALALDANKIATIPLAGGTGEGATNGLMTAADKAKLDAFGDASTYKTKQTAVVDTGTGYVSSITQDTNGVVSVTKTALPTYTLSGSGATVTLTPSSGTATSHTIPDASTSAKGVVQLTDATDSTSTTTAATANAVKTAKDAADTADGKAVTAQGGVEAIETRAAALLTAVGESNPTMTTANEIKAAVEALYNALRAFATKA